nr:ribonuclease H-like domain-containing protein [Tanacetum cinerariifolium]
MLLMALLNEHRMIFNQYKDVKTLFAAIETRFNGNEDTKKTQKILLKQLNKYDLDTMSIHDLYNNFKIVKQEVKGTACSNTNSQNIAFVSSPSLSSTNEVPTAYGVSTASTQSSTASIKVSTANLSDAIMSWNQDSSKRTMNVEETPPKAMVSIDGVGFDWSYMAEDEVPTNMALMAFLDSEASKILDKLIGSQITDKSRKGVGFESYNAVSPPPTGLFSPPKIDLSYSGLEEFQQTKFESYGPKSCKIESKNPSENTPNELKESTKVKESYDVSLVKKLVSDDKLEKKTVVPTYAKIEFIKAKQQEKPVRKPVKYAEMYMSQGPRRNQRNWNNLKSQQLGRQIKLMLLRPQHVRFEDLPNLMGRPQQVQEDQGYVDSGCSRHMTGNISYLVDFKEFNRGYVTFRGEQMVAELLVKELFTLVFFLATKDETSCILKKFVTEIEILVDKKVKTEAVNTACYVHDRVLVVKPHNKTPYELFRGRTHALSFMKPFGCYVTILNTLDHLGKFDGKSNEGFFVGYSLNSTNSNDYVGTEATIGKGHSSKETGSSQDYILMPLWKDGSLFDSSSKNATNDEPHLFVMLEIRMIMVSTKTVELMLMKSLQTVLMILTVSTASPKSTHVDFLGDKPKGDMSNINTTSQVPSTLNTRIHKDHSLDLVIGDVQSGVLTRKMIKTTHEQGWNVKSDFLYGRIKEEVYVCQPLGFEDPAHPNKVYKVVKALYGLHQAPRAWYETLAKYLLDNRF